MSGCRKGKFSVYSLKNRKLSTILIKRTTRLRVVWRRLYEKLLVALMACMFGLGSVSAMPIPIAYYSFNPVGKGVLR